MIASDSPLESILARLENAKGAGGKWTARCPAHDDRGPSLSISTGEDGRVLLKCFAGCAVKDIVASIGMTMAHLFAPKPNGKASRNGKPSGPKTYPKWHAAMRALDFHLGTRTAMWPYHDADGILVAVVGRWDAADGKTFRPVSRHGDIWRIGDPPGKWPIYRLPGILKSSGPICITEGEKCADVAVGIGLTATTSAHGAHSPHKTDWAPLAGRDAIILPDADDAGERYAVAVARMLMALTPPARVKIVRLPGLSDGEDIADYKARRDESGETPDVSASDEITALAAAVEWEVSTTTMPATPRPDAGGADADDAPMPNEADDDPHRLARLFIAERCQHLDGLTLLNRREQWYRWDGSACRELPDEELRAELTQVAKAEMDKVNIVAIETAIPGKALPTVHKITKGMLANVEGALASLTILSASVEPPAWWNGRVWERRNLIALSNGLLDLDAIFAGKSEITLPHSPRWFSETCLRYPFDTDSDCPRWIAFLKRNLEDDQERIALLQEWFGLCLTPDTSRQKFIVLEGEGSNGKSVVCAALEAVLGKENCSHVPLEVFGERFQLTPTIGKLANICSEVGELDKVAEGFLKSFTSGDTMQFDRKHKLPIQSVPTARLVLATNNRPRFSDRSGGLWRRMILMPFRVVIGADDPGRVYGMDKSAWWEASGELPGIFNWALVGLDRLRRQDRFTASQVCESALAEYRTENNPARLFLTETCRELPDHQTPCGQLYQTYRAWCQLSGYSPLADRSFGKEVRRVFPKAERREVSGYGSRFYVYKGIVADALSG